MQRKGIIHHPESMRFKFIISVLIFLVLSGCSYFTGEPLQQGPQSYTSMPFALRQQKLMALTQWQLNGSFSIQQSGQMPIIANYEWQQFNFTNYHIEMNAPLNLMSAVITGQPGWVSLQSSQGVSRQAGSPELLMQTMLGWSLPISNLIYWVRGLPANTLAVNKFVDPYGHLTAIQQDGWNVQLSRYETIAPGIDLPGQIDLQRQGLAVKILAKSWSLAAASAQ